MLSGEEFRTFLSNTVQVLNIHFQEILPFLYLTFPRLWLGYVPPSSHEQTQKDAGPSKGQLKSSGQRTFRKSASNWKGSKHGPNHLAFKEQLTEK